PRARRRHRKSPRPRSDHLTLGGRPTARRRRAVVVPARRAGVTSTTIASDATVVEGGAVLDVGASGARGEGVWPMGAGALEGLVGRTDELMRLVESVTGPDGHGAVVSGPAGVGKSALVRGACDHLASPSLTVLSVRATRAVATIPFGAFARFVPTTAS